MSARGIKIIGEKYGGGSCCMIREATSDGLLYTRSGYSVLCDDYGNNVDLGVKLVSEYMNNLK